MSQGVCEGCGRAVGLDDSVSWSVEDGFTWGRVGRWVVSLSHMRPGRLCLQCLAARALVAPLALALAFGFCTFVYFCLTLAGCLCRRYGIH